MIKNIKIICLILSFVSCSSYKNKTNEFKVTERLYNRDSALISEFTYDSHTNTLYRYFQKAHIKLNRQEKQDIYNYFIKLNLKNQSVCIKHEDSSISKIDFVFNNLNNNNKCTIDNIEIEKYLLLYAKIRNYLMSKEEYKSIFLNKSEEY